MVNMKCVCWTVQPEDLLGMINVTKWPCKFIGRILIGDFVAFGQVSVHGVHYHGGPNLVRWS